MSATKLDARCRSAGCAHTFARPAGHVQGMYGHWWQEQIDVSDCINIFGAHLIGDAQAPEKFTPMSFGDLACCRCADSLPLSLQVTTVFCAVLKRAWYTVLYVLRIDVCHMCPIAAANGDTTESANIPPKISLSDFYCQSGQPQILCTKQLQACCVANLHCQSSMLKLFLSLPMQLE